MNSSNCPCKTTVSTICCVIWSGICSVLLWQLSMVWGGRRGGGVCVWGESGGGCGGGWTGFWVAYNTEASFSTQARPHSSSTLCDHVSLTGNKPTKENKAKRREEKKKDTELKRPSLETWHTDTHSSWKVTVRQGMFRNEESIVMTWPISPTAPSLEAHWTKSLKHPQSTKQQKTALWASTGHIAQRHKQGHLTLATSSAVTYYWWE